MFKQFIVGSSSFVVLPFFGTVMNIDKKDKNYSYAMYTIVAPIYLGLMNVLGSILFKGQYRFILTGLISGIIVALVATLLNSYNFTKDEWNQYYIRIVIRHVITFGIIVNVLENNICLQ